MSACLSFQPKLLSASAVISHAPGLNRLVKCFFIHIRQHQHFSCLVMLIQTHELILQIIGGIFLIIVGLKIYFDNPLKQIRMKKRVTKKGLLGDFLTLFFLTVSNPVAIVVFMAVFAGASVFGDDPSYRIELFVLSGVVIGGGLWWYTLSTLVNIFRKKFRLRVLITINRVSGVLITVLGGLVILAAFEPFRSLLPAA